MRWNDFINRLSFLLEAAGCCFLYLIIEAISRHSVTAAWSFMVEHPIVFLYNAGYILSLMLISHCIRRRVFWRILVTVFWLLLGMLNGLILANRVTPFTGPDMKLVTDGLSVLRKYLPEWQAVLGFVLLGILGISMLILLIKAPRYRGRMHRLIAIPLTAAAIALFYFGATNLLLEKRILSNYFGNIAFAYEDYGYPYCLFTTIFNTGISQPRDYSEAEIRRIERSESSLPATQIESRPNILFLQLESFMDPMEVDYLELSEDPIPVFRSLMKEYSSGYFKVPAVGAGTANTEFETISGMSLHYFGPGEYPYKSILKESTCESTAYILKEEGYATHAIHNNEANFYGRRTVFTRLGFDTFVSEEYMPEEDDVTPTGWVRDRILTDEILKCLSSTEGPDYIYTISVQGHGDYPSEQLIEDPKITVSGAPTQELNYKWEYYVNQINEMDDFVGELITALSDWPEDVVLVMYGDHLPTMGLTVEDLKNRYLFQTEYVLWDNMGMEKKNVNLASYQIAAEVLDRIGIHDGTIFRFHQARRNSRNYQVDLEMLQYDILYGKKYSYPDGINPFTRTKMRLGLYDVTLDSLQLVSALDNTYYIKGTNFTPSSQIKLNGEWYDTVYINPTMLLITGTQLNDFDRLAVVQRSNSSTHNALSKSYDRACYALYETNRWKIQHP